MRTPNLYDDVLLDTQFKEFYVLNVFYQPIPTFLVKRRQDLVLKPGRHKLCSL